MKVERDKLKVKSWMLDTGHFILDDGERSLAANNSLLITDLK